MAFDIYIKDNIANQINEIEPEANAKKITVISLNITDGLLKKGNYYIPRENILLIKEV